MKSTQLIKTMKNLSFAKYSVERKPLRRNKEILKGSTLASFNPVLVNDILRSNTRLRHADDLPYDIKCPIILPKRNSRHATDR